jgi:hypothetical protein
MLQAQETLMERSHIPSNGEFGKPESIIGYARQASYCQFNPGFLAFPIKRRFFVFF